MSRTHWASSAYPYKWTRGIGNRYRTACGRWLPLDRMTLPERVTCKQCRAYLRRLVNEA